MYAYFVTEINVSSSLKSHIITDQKIFPQQNCGLYRQLDFFVAKG